MRVPAILFSALALSAGCAASTYPLNPQLAAQAGLEAPSFTEKVTAKGSETAFQQQGSCSWYGPGFHGRRTANGETYDQHNLTAAHRTLPFGSQVQVTDVRSGKQIVVRINDRGPYVRGRILDLSYAAAASLGIADDGVANVQLKLMDIGESNSGDQVWALEVGSFKNKFEASRFLEGLSAQQRSAGLYYMKAADEKAEAYTVRFGPFACEKTANSAKTKLEKVGLKPSVTREEITRSVERPVAQRAAAPAKRSTARL